VGHGSHYRDVVIKDEYGLYEVKEVGPAGYLRLGKRVWQDAGIYMYVEWAWASSIQPRLRDSLRLDGGVNIVNIATGRQSPVRHFASRKTGIPVTEHGGDEDGGYRG